MPLINSGSSIARSKNIGTEIAAGKPRAQAVAIGYAQQRRAKGKTSLAQAKKDRRGT
jgi:hypothetical protein